MRKSPYRHDVGAYSRKDGTKVSGHPRGSGARPSRTRSSRTRPRRTVGKVFDQNTDMGKAHAWTVNFTYDDPSVKGETVLIFADTYDGAIDEAFDEREYKHLVPTATELIDPSIGQIMSAVGKGAKRVPGIGARFAITTLKVAGGTAKEIGRRTIRLAKYKAQKHVIEALLNDCYGPRGVRRTAARISLKRNYPEIWDMTSLSVDRPTRKRKKKKPKKKKP